MKSWQRAQSIVGTSKGRPDDDFYPTPAHVTEALLSVEQFDGMIWECACGTGKMSDVLMQHKYSVFSTDIVDRGYIYQDHTFDFLKTSLLTHKRICNIVTNPPFRLAKKFVDHAVNYWNCDKVALFCKLAFLEGANRSVLLQQTRLSRVWVFRKRVLLTRNGEQPRGTGMIAFAWFVWEKGWKTSPEIGWI